MRKAESTLAYILFAAFTTPIQAQWTEVVLHNFGEQNPHGANPFSGLLRDSAGNLYGTAEFGGIGPQEGIGGMGYGVVYKVSPSGAQTVIHRFAGGADGANPNAGLVAGAEGNLYGVTPDGGLSNDGVVFKIDPAGKETIFYTFPGGANGEGPTGGLVTDSAGNLYGGTQGGYDGAAVVYKLSPAGEETVLHTFAGPSDGAGIIVVSAIDPNGNVYGTASSGGGNAESGLVFEVSAAGQETILYTFTGGSDGESPLAGVVPDGQGNLYGTTWLGGSSLAGVVFKLDPAGQEAVIYSFTGGADGGGPEASVIFDSEGNLYSTTEYGGDPTVDDGVVFKLNTQGQETVLYTFTGGADGSRPQAGVILDASGDLYGTAAEGGAPSGDGFGVIYKLSAAGAETSLYTFTHGPDGTAPSGLSVIPNSPTAFYGTTCTGGSTNIGTVYEVGSTGKETVLYTFTGNRSKNEITYGGCPSGAVVADAAGNLYGTTEDGGTFDGGSVFELDASSGRQTALYSFKGGGDGLEPEFGVIRDSAGNFYGTTFIGGIDDIGVVFKVNANGEEKILHAFTGAPDGAYPNSTLIADSDGNLYGTTEGGGTSNAGTVFEVSATGKETILFSFTDAIGRNPGYSLIRDSAGNLYGTTRSGTINVDGCCGSSFKIEPSGKAVLLHSFSGTTGGADPHAGVIADSQGNLYGTTFEGGTSGEGLVYQLTTSGQFNVLYNFTGSTDGGQPSGSLVLDAAGNLYGTTESGGGNYTGAVFKLTPP